MPFKLISGVILVVTTFCFTTILSHSYCQELYLGYNASYYYRGFKQLSIEQNQFNSLIGEPDEPFRYSNIMHGPELGYGGIFGNFSFSMTWRMRRLKAAGSHTYLDGSTEFKELKLTHNVFVMGIMFGDENGRFRIGYEVELGQFKRRDRLSPDQGWEKLRNGTFTGAINLVAAVRIGGSEEGGGFILKPYWRMSGYIYKHDYTQFSVKEFYNLQSFGVSGIISINLNK